MPPTKSDPGRGKDGRKGKSSNTLLGRVYDVSSGDGKVY